MGDAQGHGIGWIGTRIRSLRKREHYTREALAKELDISPGHLYRIETGRRVVRLPLLQKMADFFQVPPQYFLQDEATSRAQGMIKPPLTQLPLDIHDGMNAQDARAWLEATREAVRAGLQPEDLRAVIELFRAAKKRWEEHPGD